MKPKTLLLLVFAGGCGLVAMLFVQQAMRGNQGQAKVETARVLVAIADISPGVKLSEVNVAFRELPVTGLPADAILTPEGYADRSAKLPLVVGDVIGLQKLNAPGVFGANTNIPKGMRVKTINVNDTHTHAGLLQPGDRVDVIVTYQGKDERNGRMTKVKTLLEFVEVFATDDRVQNKATDGSESGKAKNVSLLLTPEQAHYVTIAENKGQLSLLWRRRDDDELVQSNNVDEALLDELEGTAGINDPVPLYSSSNGRFGPQEPADMGPDPRVLNREPVAQPAPAPAQFLDSVNKADNNDDQLAVETNMINVPAEKPKWVMEVYQGNQPVPAEFEIPETKDESKPATSSTGGSVSDIVKQFWSGGRTTKAAVPASP